MRTQRIQQLETLLQEYKDMNQRLSDEIDALGGDPAAGLGNGTSRTALVALIEEEKKGRAEIQTSANHIGLAIYNLT